MMRKQSGFTVVEGLIIVVVLVVIGGSGYLVWHRQQHAAQPVAASTSAKLSYSSPPVTTSSAPTIKNGADLNSALQTLNQTDVSAGNVDSTQLGTQAAGF